MEGAKIIKGGFTFCGIDIAELGLYYAPENENTYVYRPTDINVHEETFDGYNGGYFYGVTRQPKEFTLRCYFENNAIDRGIMERIYNLFRTGKSGKLVFAHKPWCYYYATVTSLPHPELSNYLNGLITITMKAYYPFARSDDMFYETDHDKYLLAMESTGLVESEDMVPIMSFTNLTSSTSFILHNPGNEFAPVSIIAAGDAGLGVTIRNNTTKQECRIVAMDEAHTSSANPAKYVYIDGMNGSTTLVGGGSPTPAFMYHDCGFIQLAPAYPVIRNVYIEDGSSNIITVVNTLYENMENKYIYIDGNPGGWHKIIEQIDEHTLKLEDSVSTVTTNRTIISSMNEIEVIPDDTMNLTQLSFSYKPTYA